MAFIEMRGVEKTYPNGLKALKGIDLSFEKGSFVVIVGSSGAGKSTLLRTINALDPATSGSVHIDGVEANRKHQREVRKRVAMVFQQFNLVDRLSVMTNVLTGRLAYCHPLLSLVYLFKRKDMDLAHEALGKVGLVEKAWDRADTLSGGQQQRVAIARSLAQKPDVILADEPVASLDPVTSREVLELLSTISREQNITVIVNLHQPSFTHRYADRVVGLREGKVVFDGAPNELTTAITAKIYGDTRPCEKDESNDQPMLAYA